MSESINGWTVETLRRHVEALMHAHDLRYEQRYTAQTERVTDALVAQKEALSAALASTDKAVSKAEQAQLRVNEGQNEFRASLKDQASTLATKEFVDTLERRIRALEGAGQEHIGKGQGISLAWAVTVTIVMVLGGFVMSLIGFWIGKP